MKAGFDVSESVAVAFYDRGRGHRKEFVLDMIHSLFYQFQTNENGACILLF
jgi:hypothetical protein